VPSLRDILRRSVVLAAALALAGPAPASAHDPLQAAESEILGADHAAEHALLRELESSPAARRQLERAERTARRMAAATAAAGPLDQDGRWSPPFNIGAMAINAAMLPTGKVLWFSYPWSPDYGPNRAHETVATLWDPAKGTGAGAFKAVPPRDASGNPVNLFCAGISFLADGQVLVTGGNLMYPAESPGGMYAGLKDVYTFDPWTESWTPQPKMSHGRWYPSQLLLPDGRTWIMGGLDEFGFANKNQDLELFNPPTSRGGQGSVSLLGPAGVLGDPGRPPVGDYYPHLFWMPSGRALVAGPYTIDSWWLDRPGNPSDFTWADIDNFSFSRVWGSAVLVPGGPDGSHEVLQLGGSDKPAADAAGTDALATATTISFDERVGTWDGDESMNVARSHLNTVLLPDSSMVTVGGGRGSVNASNGQYAVQAADLQVELWNPATRKWRLGPAQQEFRAYHSTALLLPDGRVVSAGDDFHGPSFTQDTAEIYEPPYLFDGDSLAPRPAIAAAPADITWAQGFDIAVTPAASRDVTRAVLVAPGATTHAVDGNQRVVPLRTTSTGSALRAEAPPNRDVAPPGVYMLFVLDATGTPSVARWVRLGDPLPAPSPPPIQPGSPPPVVTQPKAKLPKVRARIVRRGHRRYVQLRVARSTAPRVRVRLRLFARRHRLQRSRLVTVRTGRTTVVRSVRVPRRIRSVSATARSLRR
jgi:hypothetical protein